MQSDSFFISAIFPVKELLQYHKSGPKLPEMRYTILKKHYIIHRSSNGIRALNCRIFLKYEGVNPVILLNWLDRCATLL